MDDLTILLKITSGVCLVVFMVVGLVWILDKVFDTTPVKPNPQQTIYPEFAAQEEYLSHHGYHCFRPNMQSGVIRCDIIQ